MKKRFLLLLSAAVFSAGAAFAQAQKIVADKIIGIVGDKIILLSDVQNALADAMRQGAQLPENPECIIMEQALTSKLLMLAAIKDSLPVGEEEIEAELDQRVRYFIRQYGTQEELERIAGKTIYQIKDEARESVRENKLAQAMQRKIVENVRITPTEVTAYYNRIPKDSLPYFESELEIGQIVAYPKASKDLEQYVITEMENYRKQVQTKLITFEQAAKKYSEDPGTRDNGGIFQMNRNDKTVDPSFLSTAFRLKEGEISNVFKSKFGYHIIQMVQRNGEDAVVRHILRIPPITDVEMKAAVDKLDSVRAKLITGTMDFNTAAGRYSEDEMAKFAGPFLISRNGDVYNTIDELDKDVVAVLDRLKVGEFSQPQAFTDPNGGKKAVRILYLKSRSEPHRLNPNDDYNRISQAALEEKKALALDKWMKANMQAYYIMVDDLENGCPQLKRWTESGKAATAAKPF